jgi:LysR family hydrogen peroxide-inducible transcriptional activator
VQGIAQGYRQGGIMKTTSIGFSFRDLQYVVAVAEELNFHKAALRCSVSQSTLSIQLKKCEAYLGAALFLRDQHSVALTPVGVEIVAFARVAIDAAQLIKEHARRKQVQVLGPSRRTAAHARARLARTVGDLEDQSRFFVRGA